MVLCTLASSLSNPLCLPFLSSPPRRVFARGREKRARRRDLARSISAPSNALRHYGRRLPREFDWFIAEAVEQTDAFLRPQDSSFFPAIINRAPDPVAPLFVHVESSGRRASSSRGERDIAATEFAFLYACDESAFIEWLGISLLIIVIWNLSQSEIIQFEFRVRDMSFSPRNHMPINIIVCIYILSCDLTYAKTQT